MDLVSWFLNAIGKIFSTRKMDSEEPTLDIEEVSLFGLMIAGPLLIGLGIGLVYRALGSQTMAVTGLLNRKLDMILEGSRKLDIILECSRQARENLITISDELG